MDKKVLAREIKMGKWNRVLRPETVEKLEAMSEEQVKAVLDDITDVPINYSKELSGAMFDLYFIASWNDAFGKIQLPENARVLEVASGSSDPVPQALEIYTKGKGSYVTANLNKILTEGMYRKTADLKIDVHVVEDNASNLEEYFQPETFDVVCFQHAINDMIQTIIADKMGIDTVNNDWFKILPDMVQEIMRYEKQGKLKEVAYDAFLDSIRVCYRLLKKGGYLIFNTHVFEMDLKAGYSLELYGNFIPLGREWILSSDLAVENKNMDSFDPQWWMFLKKI